MQITTVIGLVAGFACLVISIFLGGQDAIKGFFDVPSLFITLGGTIASTILSYPGKMLSTLGSVCKIIFKKHKEDLSGDIDLIIQLANMARKEGLLSLENKMDEIDDDFVKKGIMLIVDGADPEFIKNVLETDIYFIQQRHSNGQAIFDSMAAYAPAFGMIGTLIGLINMLRKLEDPSQLGPDMSVALVTTFYGAVLAYVVFMPISKKLKALSESECMQKELLLEGMLSIQSGENPRLIKDKLMSFTSKRQRQHMEGNGEKQPLNPETREINH